MYFLKYTLRNCLSLQNGLISHKPSYCCSVPRCQEDECRWGSSHNGFQRETVHWLLDQVGHVSTHSALRYRVYRVTQSVPRKTYRIRKHHVLLFYVHTVHIYCLLFIVFTNKYTYVCVTILNYITNAATCFGASAPSSVNFHIVLAKVIKYYLLTYLLTHSIQQSPS